jgi:hypothetical protein
MVKKSARHTRRTHTPAFKARVAAYAFSTAGSPATRSRASASMCCSITLGLTPGGS